MEPTAAPDTYTSIWSLIAGSYAKNWGRLLVRDHASPQAKLALFQACRDGRDLVLGAADHVIMAPVEAVHEDPPGLPASMASMQAVKSALLTRGNLRTMLHLAATAGSQLTMVNSVLGSSTAWLEDLVILAPAARLSSANLAAFATSCPNLRALGIDATLAALPSPELFPNMKELVLRFHQQGNAESMLSSTAPYMSQLTNLAVAVGIAPPLPPALDPTHLPLLLNPTNMGNHLCTLNIDTTLNDTLLGLLLQCAPILTNLLVRSLQLTSDVHTPSQATWQHLQVSADMWLSSLARLPQTAGMNLMIPACIVCDITTHQEAQEAWDVFNHFKVVTFDPAQYVVLGPGAGLEDDSYALRVALTLLHVPARTTSIITGIALHGWVMSFELMHQLSEMPSVGSLVLAASLTWLPQPHLYSVLFFKLPESLHDLCIEHGPVLTQAHYQSILRLAPMVCTSEAPLRVKLQGCEPDLVETIQHTMQQQGVHPHVHVSV